MSAPSPALLELWTSVDWRFLLPHGEIRRVGFLGAPPPDERRVLEELGVRVLSAPDDRLTDLDVLIVTEGHTDLLRPSASDLTFRSDAWILVRLARGASSRLGAPLLRRARLRLRECGFEVQRTYWHAPSRARTSYLVATDDSFAVDQMLRRHQGVRFGFLKSLAARAVTKVGIVEWIARDLTVLARPAPEQRSAGEPAASDAAPLPTALQHELTNSASPPARLLVTPWFEASRHVICLYFDPGVRAMCGVAKLPRRPDDIGGIRHEADALGELSKRAEGLVQQAPEVTSLSISGRPYLLETPVVGRAAGPEVVRSGPEKLLSAAMSFLEALPTTGSTVQDPSWFERLLDRPLADVETTVGEDSVPELVSRTLSLLEPLRGSALPLVFEHGDLGHPNLVFTRDGRLAAVDWERAEVHGLPGHDLVFLLQYVAESLRATFEMTGQRQAFDDAFTGADAWALPWLRRYAASLGVDTDLIPLLVLASWARTSAGLLVRVRPAGPSGMTAASRQQVVRSFQCDRDFALWQHALLRFDRLAH